MVVTLQTDAANVTLTALDRIGELPRQLPSGHRAAPVGAAVTYEG